jgi:hypothetical protein
MRQVERLDDEHAHLRRPCGCGIVASVANYAPIG